MYQPSNIADGAGLDLFQAQTTVVGAVIFASSGVRLVVSSSSIERPETLRSLASAWSTIALRAPSVRTMPVIVWFCWAMNWSCGAFSI